MSHSDLVSLHHLASTGGTVITKLLATSPEVRVLSEIHPLRPIRRGQFSPTAVTEQYVRMYKTSRRDRNQLLRRKFQLELEILHKRCQEDGKVFVLRDWSHGDFVAKAGRERLELFALIRRSQSLSASHRAIVTIRDPMHSYVSGLRSGFLADIDDDFATYCERVKSFVERYRTTDATFLRYEDIIQRPREFLGLFSEMTGATFPDDFEARLDDYRLTGDSGRRSTRLQLRPPRGEDLPLIEKLARHPPYRELARDLGYST